MSATIRILHLSDLHFGDFNRFAGRDPKKLGKTFYAALAEARKQLGDEGPIDLVVVSGDIAERGKPKEFAAGRVFLETVSGGLGLLPQRFVFVPGNHDISRPQCAIVEELQKDEDFDDAELRRRIELVKLKFYDDFVLGFYGLKDLRDFPAMPLGRGGWLYSFPELRLSVGALSSCEKENHKEHVGCVGEEQAQSLMSAWRDGELRDWLKVVVVHHNPDLTTPNNLDWWKQKLKAEGINDPSVVDAYFSDICGMEGAGYLRRIVEDSQVQLVLHGHQHAGDEKIWPWRGPGQGYVLSAGSMGLSGVHLPKDEPLSCRLIRLDLEAGMLDARRLVFTAWAKTPGEVESGGFTLDPAERDGYQKRLELPTGFAARSSKGKTTPVEQESTENLAKFLRFYRQRMSGVGSSWALQGVAQNAASGRPLEGQLDEMYVELRFFKELDPAKTDLGKPIGVNELQRRTKPLMLRGAAGTGKTTWVQRTFRRLITDEKFVPLLLVLRDLSRLWQDPGKRGPERSLDDFLDQWVGEHLGSGYGGKAGELLRLEEGPRPVLLVDGWDEIGELGEEVRRKLLGLMRELPRLLVIVTSRPYGKNKPSYADGFDSLEVQPLSDADMKELSRKFFRLCHPGDEVRAKREVEEFEKAFAASADARSLARTPLFLTMMLMIGRAKPLPDKRHLLYEACVENLLQALPEKRERGGAQILDEQWRPADSEERWRVVAKLAFEVQSQGYGEPDSRGAIVRRADELFPMLPPAWSHRDKGRFLSWLAGPAGLLSDRTDGTFQFSHLSFQEYLAAWHLDSTREGGDRSKAFAELGKSTEWWETLQLWAALIDRKNPQHLDEVLASIGEVEWDGLSLAGMILADGSASTRALESWTRALSRKLMENWPIEGDRCLRAWQASAQHERKTTLGRELHAASEYSCVPWYRASYFCQAAGEAPPPFPVRKLVSRAILEQVSSKVDRAWSASQVAGSRLWVGRHPLWPLEPAFAGFLHVWPNRRRWLGARLQALAVCCPQVDLKPAGAQALMAEKRIHKDFDQVARDFSRDFSRDFARHFTSDSARDFASDFVRYFASDFARYFARDLASYFASYFARYFARDFASYFASYFSRYFASDFSLYFSRDFASDFASDFSRNFATDFARNFARNFASDFAREVGISLDGSGLMDFAKCELLAAGRSGARFALTVLEPSRQEGISKLFCLAARLSGQPNSDAASFNQALAEIGPTLHPIWPALAKHIARRSTPEDRALLLDYAEHPEKAGEPLCWGLQFIVRGDVMREDGSIVTLDEISAAAGLEPLPLLEDMPPELEF